MYSVLKFPFKIKMKYKCNKEQKMFPRNRVDIYFFATFLQDHKKAGYPESGPSGYPVFWAVGYPTDRVIDK